MKRSLHLDQTSQLHPVRVRLKLPFLAFAVVAVLMAGLFGATAFNYATVGARTVTMTIVQDDGAVIAIDQQDPVYDCYSQFDGTSGKISITFDPGCSGGATGLNPSSIYYFHDILKITNKGQKDWQRLWVNSSDALLTLNLTYSTDATMTTGSTFVQNDQFASTLAIGGTVYVGIKLDGSTKTKAETGWSVDLTVAARASA